MDNFKKGIKGENFVNNIAYNSFLKYWCYPNPLDIIKDNKEICDLLIWFDDTCIIISVKNYSFKGNYSRYFNNTTSKAVKQISGAERRLFRDDNVLIKHPDRNEEIFIKEDIKKVFRIVINLNNEIKYYKTSYNTNKKQYIIFDSYAWLICLNELNTIPDFIDYLEKRINLFKDNPTYILPREEYDFNQSTANQLFNEIIQEKEKNNRIINVLGSELDLIAIYIKHYFNFPENIYTENHEIITIKIDGEWEKLVQNKIIKTKDDSEKESYFVDKLVKEMIIQAENGNHLAKIFYKFNRNERSIFASSFLKYHNNILNSNKDIIFERTHVSFSNFNMVFVFFNDNIPKDELDDLMRQSLVHHNYLKDYNCNETGGLGMSRSTNKFIFGYLKQMEELNGIEKNEIENNFKKLGWKLKNVT